MRLGGLGYMMNWVNWIGINLVGSLTICRCSSMCHGGILRQTRWWAHSSHSAPRANSRFAAQPRPQRPYSGSHMIMSASLLLLFNTHTFLPCSHLLFAFTNLMQIHRAGAGPCPIWRPLQRGWYWILHFWWRDRAHCQTFFQRNCWDSCYWGWSICFCPQIYTTMVA